MKIDNIEEQKLNDLEVSKDRKMGDRKAHIMSKISTNYYVRTDILSKNIN